MYITSVIGQICCTMNDITKVGEYLATANM